VDTGNRKAVLAALAANLGIAVAKFVGFGFTRAASMLAEGVHSVADCGNQALLLWGGTAARRAPTAEHPFGFGRERFFWSFVVAMVLFTMGSGFALYEGIHKLHEPEPLSAPSWAVGILAACVVMEGLSFRTAVVEARRHKGTESWWAYVHGTKSPELAVVLLEDLGALIGLGLALTGVGLAWLTGDATWDALGSLLIGLLLGLIAVLLASEMKSMLIGEAASASHRRTLERAIATVPTVARLIDMRTLHLGPEEVLVTVKIEFDGSLPFARLARAIDEVEAAVRAALPALRVVMYVEPDVFDPGRAG